MFDKDFRIKENRINNLQWAAAKNYDVDTFIIGENLSGNPDFYMNLIIGLAIKFFGIDSLNKLFDNWTFNIYRNKFDMLTIYLLEDFCYRKEVKNRNVLKSLRKNYAREFLDDKHDLARRNLALKENLVYSLQMKKMNVVLGNDYKKLNNKERLIYGNFYLAEDTNGENIEKRVLNLLIKYARYKENYNLKPKFALDFNLFGAAGNVSLERSNMPSMFKDDKVKKSGQVGNIFLNFMRKKKSQKLSYIEKTFGKSLFDEEKRLAIENEISVEGHRKSKIYFTKGIENNDKDLNQELNDKAVKRHLLKFNENKNLYNSAITSLTKKLKLSISSNPIFEEELSNRGKLVGKIAYKSQISDRVKIFEHKIKGESNNLTVDLILDASASLLHIESDIAIEAYILSKSLENNNIRNRIISYQTVQDYTVITILKDYYEKSDIKRIFRYKSMGWNRDGYFFKAYRYLIGKNKNLFSIILTDANPSDFRPLVIKGIRPNKNYSDEVSLEDTEKELLELRKMGAKISAVLNRDNTQNARKLYKNKFVKIQKISQIANVAGKFIQKEINKK